MQSLSKKNAPRHSWFFAAGASLLLACGSTEKDPDAKNAAGGSQNITPSDGGSATTGGMGGDDGGSGGQGADSAGGSNTGGAIGNGERDATCRTRTSNHVGGERIVLRNGVTSEGDQVFLGFYDTVKELECDIRQDFEGKSRCMPVTRGDRDLDNVYFLDDQCAEEVDYRGICAKDHDSVRVSLEPGDERRRFFGLGDPLPDSQVYSINSEGVCEAYGTLNNLRTMGPELDPSEFAEVDPVVWRGAGRLWTEGYQGDDGLEVMQTLLDTTLNLKCDFESLSTGTEHCRPETLGILGFTDSTCEEKLVTGFDSCEAPLLCYAIEESGDACNPVTTYLKALDVYEGENYLVSSCGIAMNQEAVTYYTEEVPEGEFVSVESTTFSDDPGRLKPMYQESSDGGCFFQGWWDEELQTPCAFGLVSGKYYCMPGGETTSSAVPIETFSDDACEEPAFYLKLPDCEGATTPRFLSTYAPTCDGTARDVRAVTAEPAELPALWILSDDTCVEYVPEAQMIYHALGDIMPPSTFVEATPEM